LDQIAQVFFGVKLEGNEGSLSSLMNSLMKELFENEETK
jgi:hypothetical protein